MDPRIPDDHEAFEFVIEGANESDEVEWVLNGSRIARTHGGKYLWPVQRGTHQVTAAIHKPGQPPSLARVKFSVK